MNKYLKKLLYLAICCCCCPYISYNIYTSRKRRWYNLTEQDKKNAMGADYDTNVLFDFSSYECLPEKFEKTEWLSHVSELGQTFDEFKNDNITIASGVINIMLLDNKYNFDIDKLSDYVTKWFQKPVKIFTHITINDDKLDGVTIRKRYNDNTESNQYNVMDINDTLKKIKVKLNVDNLIALTNTDLYPEDNWNFVFGLAYYNSHVGTHSLYHFDDTDFESVSKVLVHEIGHMFGMEHCVYFRCTMNGFMSLEELKKVPNKLCPICLRKFEHIGIDLDKREHELTNFSINLQ